MLERYKDEKRKDTTLHVAIIGNGVTGVTAATRLRKKQPDWKISLISGESTHHFSRPALMYLFMGHMTYQQTKPFEDRFWIDQRLDLVRDWVTSIDYPRKTLTLHNGGPMPYDKLLIATGSKSNKFGWPGQDLAGVQGLYSLMDLRLLYENVKNTRHAVIVGGGLIGIELAEMLHSRNIDVTFLIREVSYWDNIMAREESELLNHIIKEQGIGLITETNMKEIVDDGTGRACGVVTEFGKRIECQFVGLTPGVSPNTDLVKGSEIETGRGILVDGSFRTSVADVFAAGDCAEIQNQEGERNLIQQVWYTGKKQGEVVGDVLAGEERAYDPGIWYNSAKFLNLEYQTYGSVNMKVPDEKNIYWQHEDKKHAVRLVYTDEGVIGFNFMGLRARHNICEQWIAEQKSVPYVLDHLAEANFDPEFFRRYEPEIVRSLKEQVA